MKRNLLRLFATIIFTLVAVGTFANDGVYYVNGNQLVPIHETDIAVKKEILTISLCDDGYARVDVQYEFMNNGSAKTVEMGFEATAPYNAEAPLNKKGGHPFISDFTVTMNGTPLKYSNSIVLTKYDEDCDFVPVDFNKYKPGDEDHLLYDPETDDMVPYAYAYYF